MEKFNTTTFQKSGLFRLAEKNEGAVVNLENDCIGKYVEHFLHRGNAEKRPEAGLTKEFLYQNGF